jgi:hypothetical protein
MYAASRPEAADRIEMQAMYSVVYLEKFALTETAGYSAWFHAGETEFRAKLRFCKSGSLRKLLGANQLTVKSPLRQQTPAWIGVIFG